MKDFIDKSKETLSNKQVELEKIRLKIENHFKTLFVNNKKNCLVQGRVKDPNSLAEKIIRKNYFGEYSGNYSKFIDELNDIIGIRIVCVLQKDENEIHDFLKGMFTDPDEFEGEWDTGEGSLFINFNNQPEIQKNSHKIYKYSCKWVEETGEEYNIEIQIKSLIHMFWGEIEHMIMYKNYGYLIDKDFYTNIMDSTFKMLEAIDDQLLAMTGHLKRGSEDETKQLVESREILAKLFFNSCQKEIETSLESKIDLREVYEALAVILTLQSNNSMEIIQLAVNYIGRAAQYNITFDEILKNDRFTLNLRNYRISANDRFSELVKEVDNIIQQPDLFWRILIDLFRHLKSEHPVTPTNDIYTNTLIEITESITRKYNEEYAKIQDPKRYEFMEKVSFKALIYTIKFCKKVTFMYCQPNLINIFCSVADEVSQQEEAEIPINYESETYIEYYTCYLTALYLKELKIKIPLDELEKLHYLHGQQESGYAKHYNAQEYENFIESKEKISDSWLEQIFNDRREV